MLLKTGYHRIVGGIVRRLEDISGILRVGKTSSCSEDGRTLLVNTLVGILLLVLSERA